MQALLRSPHALCQWGLVSQVPATASSAAAGAWGQPQASPAAGKGSLEHRAGLAGAPGFIPWARHWLIHKTLPASHSRPTELHRQKQILVKAPFITINKSRPEQTGLPWFPLFSIPISILSACCFIFPKMNSSNQQMNEKPVYICKLGGKMVTLSSSAKEGGNPGKVCLPLGRKTKTQGSWAALLALLTQTHWDMPSWLLVLNPQVLHSGRHKMQTLTAAWTPLK